MSTDTSPINVAELPVSLSAAGMELLATDAQNEIRRIDAAVFGAHTIAVKSRLTAIPPSTPESGDAYIVPSTGVASWGQPAGTLVVWNGSEWEVTAPSVGAPVWIQDERVQVVFDGEWENPTADASGAIAALVDGAPTGLDTLKKIADAIGLLAPKASPAS